MKNIISEIKTKAKQLTINLSQIGDGYTKEQLHEDAIDLLLKTHELETIYNQTSKNNSVPKKKEASMAIKDEINKLNRRLPLWANRQHQINSKILTLFLRMKEEGFSPVTEELLMEKYGNYSEFSTNFQQMKTIASKNHGKVFDVQNGSVKIWEPIREIVNEYKNAIFGKQ